MTVDEEYETIECAEHGQQQTTFVCRHLAESLRTGASVGFWQADNPGNPRPNAWCSACEQKLQATGGEWNDESEAFAGITLLCGACYDRARIMNSLQEVDIHCPYCGETIDILLDGSVSHQEYIEDCRVCCRPMHLKVTVGDSGTANVRAVREDE